MVRRQKTKKYLIVGNWKNNPVSLNEARKNFNIIKKQKFDVKKIEVVVCPSFIHLSDLVKNYRGQNFRFGAQNFYLQSEKSFTGEISLEQLKDLKINYVIVGHAERREIGEDNEMVSWKLRNALDNKFVPILCVGEKERDNKGEYLRCVEKQIIESLARVSKCELKKIFIAYEPIWAIGANQAVGSNEIHTMNIFIKKILSSVYDRKTAFGVKILYGGSVDPDNCLEILENGDVDGLLIGRASSNPYTFSDILKKLK